MDIEGLGDIFLKVCKKFNQVGVDYVIKIPVCGIEVMLRLKGNTVRPIDQHDAIFLQEKMNRRNMGNKNKRNT